MFLVITLVAFYFVLPGLLATFDALPRLRDVYPAWFVVVVLSLECASFVVRSGSCSGSRSAPKGWFDIGASHSAANAVGRAVPGGSPPAARCS